MLTIPRILIIAFVVVVLTTCEPNTIYNKTPEQYLTEVSAVSEENVGADLAIIEFDEFGMLWDRKQLEDTLSLIKRRNEESDNGIFLITYTHGWQNNADPEDKEGDLANFRKTIKDLSRRMRISDKDLPNRLVGVYLGWRGKSSNLPGLNGMTFWGRKRVAGRVASQHMRETLMSIASATKENPGSKVHMTGHSMGGMILAQTLAPSLAASLMRTGPKGLRFMADFVVLKNPALDGLSMGQFIEFFKSNGVIAELHAADGSIERAAGPTFVSITSEADMATSLAYPLGKIVGNVITATDFRTDSKLGLGDTTQKELANHSLGHIDHLTSHRAWIEDGEVKLEKIPNAYNDTLFWVIQVSKEISSGHSDVENDKFFALIQKLLGINRLYDTNAQTWLKKTRSSNQSNQ